MFASINRYHVNTERVTTFSFRQYVLYCIHCFDNQLEGVGDWCLPEASSGLYYRITFNVFANAVP